ncbi:hypothetical protein MWJ95_11120 [Lysinibacillus sp. Bpr_S20]|nr:hypothetical protein [Lysinibacillus sp. Bpr_S20]
MIFVTTGRPQEALLCATATNVLSVAKAKRQQQCFICSESKAAATNVLTVRKRSGSNKCFNCAKAKRQQQVF